MPEHGAEVPVWHGPDSEHSGNVSVDELLAMGVSSRLVERLRAWQERWEHDPFSESPPRELRPGSAMTVRLARHLQAELSGYRIFLTIGSEPRPVDDWPVDRR